MQTIKYINKAGQPMSLTGKIICKRSKVIIIALSEDDKLITIPRQAVEEITEAKKDINNN